MDDAVTPEPGMIHVGKLPVSLVNGYSRDARRHITAHATEAGRFENESLFAGGGNHSL